MTSILCIEYSTLLEYSLAAILMSSTSFSFFLLMIQIIKSLCSLVCLQKTSFDGFLQHTLGAGGCLDVLELVGLPLERANSERSGDNCRFCIATWW